MPSIIVRADANSRMLRLLREALPPEAITLTQAESVPACDLLIVAPDSPPVEQSRCRLALVPGEMPRHTQSVIRCLLTYGLKARDTLTLSSIEGGRMAVAIQRDFPDIYGRTVPRQEFLIRPPSGLSREESLCYLGGLLLFGVSPREA